MIGDKSRTIRVAAIQMESQNTLLEANLAHATSLVNRATEYDAKLILLPEFMPTGYLFSRAIWDNGEPKEGPTVKWLRETSKGLGVWLGCSYLEAEGEDFFNTFVLTNPDGTEAGRVRKQAPALMEAYFFKGSIGAHSIETQFGRVGVGICYENQLSFLPQLMQQQSVDIILMPHSCPTPSESRLYSKKAIEGYNNRIKEVARRNSRLVGVPVVMANKCGTWESPVPFPWALLGGKQKSSFPGLSAIVDSDGALKAQLGKEEAVIVEDVTLDPSRKIHEPPKCYGRWAFEGPRSRNLALLEEAMGRLSYSLSSARKNKARQISSSRA